MTPDQALMHPWIIEGLPPKVLAQHKKILGIKDDVTSSIESKIKSTMEGNSVSHRSQPRTEELSKSAKIHSLLM